MRVRSTALGSGLATLGLALVLGAPLVASATAKGPVADAVKLDETKAPVLAASQRERATSILGQDSALQTLVAGQPYKVLEIGPWSSGGALAGASVRLDLNGVRTLTGTWPGISYDPLLGVDAPHQTGASMATVRTARLTALVDFATGKVVRVLPEPPERPRGVEPPPDWSKAPPSTLGGGGGR